jgi:Amt family ammonium transporter
VGAASYLGQAGRGVTGLFYGDPKQFLVQLMGAAICVGWAFGATFIVFKMVNAVRPMRVSKEVELEGLDVPEFGLEGYPEDALSVTAS